MIRKAGKHATVAIAFALLSQPGLAGTEPSQRTTASETLQPQPYVRVTHPRSNVVELQVAMRKFMPARGSGPVIWLVGVSHLGETNYYQKLQKHLESQGLVLCEGVKDMRSEPDTFGPQNGNGEPPPQPAAASLQTTLARTLGLAFQLEAIDYNRRNFRNSDLSVEELRALLQQQAADVEVAASGESGQELDKLLGLMEGSTWLGAMVQFGIKLLGSSPKLQAITKLALLETLDQIKGDLSQFQGLPPELKGLIKVLLEARNEKVLKDVKRELRYFDRQSIAVLYGVAHMPDLERRLTAELSYRPALDAWLTPISVDLQKTRVSESDLELVRSLVKWQLQALGQ